MFGNAINSLSEVLAIIAGSMLVVTLMVLVGRFAFGFLLPVALIAGVASAIAVPFLNEAAIDEMPRV